MGYICAPVLLGLGSPLTQEKRDPSLHKKTLSPKVRDLSVSDGETETPSGGPSWGFPTRAPCLLRFPTSPPTSHRSPGPTQASGPGLGPPRRRGTGGEFRRRRGSGVGRRLPRAAVGGLFRGEEPARGRIAPRRRLPAPVPRPSSRPGARAPTPGAAPRFSASTEPAPQFPLRASPPLGDPHAHPPPPGRLGYSSTSRTPTRWPRGEMVPPPPFLGSVPGERGREARRSSPRARRKQRVPTGPAREREREPGWGKGAGLTCLARLTWFSPHPTLLPFSTPPPNLDYPRA